MKEKCVEGTVQFTINQAFLDITPSITQLQLAISRDFVKNPSSLSLKSFECIARWFKRPIFVDMDEVSKPKQLVKPRDAKPCGHCILNWISLSMHYAMWEPFWIT